MKKVLLSWIKICFRFLLAILDNDSDQKRLLNFVAEVIESRGDYVTYHCRPIMAKAVQTQSDVVKRKESLAIVMQGPIIHKDSFTLETLKIYKNHFRNAKIILSTWEDEPSVMIRQIENLGIIVILNRKPVYAGVSNINLQITSSRSGMRKAKELGAEYALKTRTDQRLYAPNLGEFFHNLTENFPVNGHWPKQRKRIVGCGLNTFKYRMYGLSDMLIYGHIDDMILYWDIGLDERVFNEKQMIQAGFSLRSFACWRVCEVYLATEYLIKIGREVKYTLSDSWSAFADHFCVIDKEQLDLYWPKYNHAEYRWLGYSKEIKTQELTFKEWLNIYANLKSKDVPENILDIPFEK